MQLLKELTDLNANKTLTYHFSMNDSASATNPPRFAPPGVDVGELTNDLDMDGEHENAEFTEVLRKKLIVDDVPLAKAGIKLLDANVTKFFVGVYQFISDTEFDEDEDGPDNPTLNDAMNSSMAAASLGYSIEFTVVSATPLTKDQGQVIVDQVGGYAWGQYWSELDGTEDWEMNEVK